MPLKDPAAKKAYQQRYQRDVWYPRNRAAHKSRCAQNTKAARESLLAELREMKSRVGCACGERDPACLDFHHSDPGSKLFTVSESLRKGYARARVLAEAARCSVLCANCHRKAHRR